ncbi:MAG TPA: PAS domain S-box protein, partial [Desulfuromonadales bacterium]|nr:PAS domain S-box protein [Desulfuromonadales bacterium]
MSFSTVDKMLDANWISSAIIEAWDGLIYVGTADHHIQFLNERFIRQLGRDATGEHCYAALHSRIAPCPWCPKEVFEGKSTRGHFQEPANGLWFDVLNAPIPKADGTFAKVAFIQPVADHKPTSRRLPVFRNLVDNLTDSVFFHEASSGRVLYANEAACRTLGYPREELLKMHKWDYAQAFVSPADWHAMVTRIEDEGNAIVETQLRRRDGGSLTVEINAAVVQTGLQRLIVSVVRDITEHKRTEERLAEERNKVEAIMAAMGDGITVQDRNFRIIYQNDVIIRRRGHHLGTFCYQAYENRDSVCDDCQAQKSFVDGCIHSRQIVVETDEGTFHREITSSPLRDAEGNIVACVEVARDITEQQRVARELRTSIEKYRLLFSAESDAIITYDEGAGTIHEVNDAACQLYGLERDEFIGRSWLELIADAGEKTSCHLCTAVHKRSDGTLFPVEFSAGTFDWDGKTMAVAIV